MDKEERLKAADEVTLVLVGKDGKVKRIVTAKKKRSWLKEFLELFFGSEASD